MIVRWLFATPRSATLNGATVPVLMVGGVPTIEFDHSSNSSVAWQ
jgi:hypothetical protein